RLSQDQEGEDGPSDLHVIAMAKRKWFRRLLKEPDIVLNPGEFEVFRTRAQRDWWQAGTIVITNHRLFWFPYNPQQASSVEVDMQKILGCVEVRSWYHLLAKPALRVLFVTGRSVDFHNVADLDGVRRNIERFMGNERYVPGTLFSQP